MIFFTPLSVRFRDLDALGHVNNAVYHSYVEEARIRYFDHVIGMRHDWQEFGLLLARTEINYLHPIRLKESIRCGLECIRIGTKSLDFAFRIEVEQDGQWEEACSGRNVLVCYDHRTDQTAPVPNDWKTKLEAFEDGLAD